MDEKKKREEVYRKVEETLKSDGWKVIEEDLKNNLRAEYSDFLLVKEEQLKEKQYRVNLLKNMLMRIYQLAGWEWQWEGYADIREELEVKKSREDEKYQDYLKSIEGGEL